MDKLIDVWLGPDTEIRVTKLIQGLVDEARSFGAREYAEKYFSISAPPGAILERCEGQEAWVQCCRRRPRSVALYVLQYQSDMGLGLLIISWIGPDERAHWFLVFDELDTVRWPIPEAGLEHIEQLFGGCLHFPDWPYLSSLLMDPARN